MCAQCWATAATATTGAVGVRAWLAAKRPDWLGPTGLRRLTVLLLVIAAVAASIRI